VFRSSLALRYSVRLLNGYDPNLVPLIKDFLKLTDEDTERLDDHLKSHLNVQIPIYFLPLQDCINLCIGLIKTTMMMQTWSPTVRGVGGAIDDLFRCVSLFGHLFPSFVRL
jgi:hypothetical protein